MSIGAALIGGASSIVGGLLGKPKTISAGRSMRSMAKYARSASEEFGFNPLTLLGVGGSPMVVGNPMGAAIADAGAHLASGMQREAEQESENAKLREQNEELRKGIQKISLRPATPGIYGGGMPTSGGVAIGRTAGMMPSHPDPVVVHNPERTSVALDGISIDPVLGLSDAEEFSKRYEDAAGMMYGLYVLGRDTWNTASNYRGSSVPDPKAKPPEKEVLTQKDLNDEASMMNARLYPQNPPDGENEEGRPYWLTPNGMTWQYPGPKGP